MIRTQWRCTLLAAAALTCAVFVWHSDVAAGDTKDKKRIDSAEHPGKVFAEWQFCGTKDKKRFDSAEKVKATYVASKIGADGKQTVTLTLDIEEGWYIYANPVGVDDFEINRTRITVKAGGKLTDVQYPPGKLKEIAALKIKLNTYPERVVIPVVVQRKLGDTSPLQITIQVNACDKGTCLPPGKKELTIP